MISGFNTDVEFDGTVYHVQTEDKGLQKRVIMSLVYDKGTILASKRESYDDLAAGDFDANVLAERVGRQHKLICAAVRAGRISELKRMSSGRQVAPQVTVSAPAAPAPAAQPSPEAARHIQPPVPPPPRGPLQLSIIEDETVLTVVPEVTFPDEPVVDVIEIIEDDVLSADAVAVVSELAGRDRPIHTKLSIELIGDTKFKGGDRRTLNIMICRGSTRRVIADAQIMVKVLGSSFRPVIFHAASDANGLARVHLQVPHFNAGRAALLVRAMSEGEEIELRRIVTPG